MPFAKLKIVIAIFHISKIYDLADRVRSKTDGEIHTEYFTPNALGLNEIHVDKCSNTWKKEFDKAKRLKREISPVIEAAFVKQKDGKLEFSKNSTAIETGFNYDNASNQTSITYAANIADQKRTVEKRYNKAQQFIGTTIKAVTVDDGTVAAPREAIRPEIVKDISTTTVLDYAGREIVKIDEQGIRQFTIFDKVGRKLFHIDAEGFVTEFNYDEAFNEPTKLIQHAVALSKDLLDAHPQGFTFEEMYSHVAACYKPEEDCSITFENDLLGQKKSATKDEIITAVDNKGDVKSEKLAPKTTWLRNAFGEVIREEVLISANKVATTTTFRDRNGNPVLEISPLGYVTENTFGTQLLGLEKKGYTLIKKIEYATPLPANADLDDEAKVRSAIIKDEKQDITYAYLYDKRTLQIKTLITTDDTFYESKLDESGKPILIPLEKHAIANETERDNEGRVIGYTTDDGNKRYVNLNARGDVTVESSFPLVTDLANPQPKIAVTEHLVDPHGQPVGSIAYANPGAIELDATSKSAKIQLPERATQDQTTLLLMDNRGCSIATQTPPGHLKYATFNACKMPVRKYHWVTGYQAKNSKVRHLRAHRMEYNKRRHISMHAIADEKTETKTYKEMNAFAECTGEGPAPNNMLLKRAFDQSGYQWFSNEDHGIPTLSFPNAKGVTVATYRAPTIDLTTDKEEAAKKWLDTDYEQTYQQVQRTVLERDLEDNIIAQHMPWYRAQTQRST